MPRIRRSVAVGGAALGILLVPLILWVIASGLPAHLESTDGFYWVGAEPGTGHPLLLREQADGRQILAGSERYGLPRGESVRCYEGETTPVREAAKARGRIEDLTFEVGFFHRLRVTTDDLGGGTTTYVYRCGANGAEPVLSWGALPGFGVRALVCASFVWLGVWLVLVGVTRRRH